MLHDRRGSVAIIFAVAIVPIIALLGLSIDAALYADAEERLDRWVEEACERANSPAQRGNEEAHRWNAAKNIIKANSQSLNRDWDVKSSIDTSDATTVIQIDHTIDSMFGSLVGVHSYDLSAKMDCGMGEAENAGPGHITFILRFRNGVQLYRINGGTDVSIFGIRGDAWDRHWADVTVYQSPDREVLQRQRLVAGGGRLSVQAQDGSLVVELNFSSASWQNNRQSVPRGRSCSSRRICIEDTNQPGGFDWNDAYYDIVPGDGSSIFTNPYRGDPYAS